MAIDQFTKEEFEKALPVNKKNGNRMWKCVGLVKGEFVYIIPIQKKSNTVKLRLVIRSSIGPDGIAAETGEDSIRVYFEAKTNIPDGYTPDKYFWTAFGKGKITHWITRVSGWEKRLVDHLRELYAIGMQVDHVRCPKCDSLMPILVVKVDTPNKGRSYQACIKIEHKPGYWKWLVGGNYG